MATLTTQIDMKSAYFTWLGSRNIPDTQYTCAIHEPLQTSTPTNKSSRAPRDPDHQVSFTCRNAESLSVPKAEMIIFMVFVFVSSFVAPFTDPNLVSMVNLLVIMPLRTTLPFQANKQEFGLGVVTDMFFSGFIFLIVLAATICNCTKYTRGIAPRTTLRALLHVLETNSFLYVVWNSIDSLRSSLGCVVLACTLPVVHIMHTVLGTLFRRRHNKKPWILYDRKHWKDSRSNFQGSEFKECLGNALDYSNCSRLVSESNPGSFDATRIVSCAFETVCFRHQSSQATKISFTNAQVTFFVATIFILPLTATAVLTISPGFRILAGVSATGTAVAVIPLRTIPEVPNKVWIFTYTAWAIAFSAYLGMQILLIPSQLSYRRKWFLSCVIIAAVHFSIGLAQTSTTLADAFSIFGPLIATVCTYVVSLVFSGGESDVEADTRPEVIAMVRTAVSG